MKGSLGLIDELLTLSVSSLGSKNASSCTGLFCAAMTWLLRDVSVSRLRRRVFSCSLAIELQTSVYISRSRLALFIPSNYYTWERGRLDLA